MSDPIARINVALEGRYAIERELGEGGMATVYLADDLKHERKVALKVLRPELAAVVGAERFLAEIKTTANLQHPHILPLFDSGEAGSFLFYVMPYVEGETLADRIDREKQLPVDEAMQIATAVANALDHAHRNKVIHRDIKPANILLQDGEPVVSDFGIALAVGVSGGRLTETGLSVGTPHYMSPEQATGDQTVGAATDIYALGAVLYEMLVGDPPYVGSTAQAILGKIIAGKLASATEERASVPSNVDAAIRRALEKLPADRFTGAQDFAKALADPAFRHGDEAVATATATVGSWKRVAIATSALSVVLAAGLGWALMGDNAAPPLTRFTVPPPDGLNLGGVCCGPVTALSPDGEWLAFVGIGGGPVYRRRLGQLEAEEVPGTEGASIPFFSPDGRWLGFHSGARLLKVPMSGGPPVPITETPSAGGASWGDNDVIAFVDNSTGTGALFTVPGAGGVATPVLGPSDGVEYNFPWMLPGGEAALMTVRAGNPAELRMVVVDLETGTADTLGFGTRAAYASGHLVFSGSDGTLLAQPFDPETRRTTGQSVAILDGVALSGPGLGQFALSAQGGLAYEAGGGAGGNTLVIEGPGGSAAVSLPEQGNIEDPAFSPDGRRIAMRFVNVGENQDIWIFDRDQGTLERLTEEGSQNAVPVWTPEGARIAFASVRDGEPPQLYWQPADGSGSAERLLATDFRTMPGSWSPDGQTLAFVGERNGSWDVGLLTLGDSTPRWILETEFNELQPQLSPDGLWLAYTSGRSGEQEVYVEAASGEGRRAQVSIDGAHSPRWAPDGDVLYYATGDGGQAGTIIAATVSTDGGFRVTSRVERFEVSDLNSLNVPGQAPSVNYDVHPEGEEFVHIRLGGAGGQTLIWILNWPEIVREMTSVR